MMIRPPRPARAAVRCAAALLGVAALAGHAVAQPANDSCLVPVVLSPGVPVSGTTVGATTEIQVSCASDTADVWYEFTPTAFSGYTITVTGKNSANLNVALIYGCGEFFGESGCAVGTAEGVRLDTLRVAGDTFLIRVGSTGGEAFTVTADFAPPPANDECAGATPLSLSTPVSTDNFSATTTLELDNATMCASIAPGVGGGADVFFSFTPAQDGYYDFSTCGAQLDTVVSVHSACPVSAANALACNDNAALSRCNNPFDTNSSYVAGVQMTAGATYFIRVAGVRFVEPGGELGEAGRGQFDILVEQGQPPVFPANDNCANAEVITADNVFFSTTVNSTPSIPGGSCGYDDLFDVWYSFTSTAVDRRAFLFQLLPGSFNNSASLTIYDACGGNVLACYASNPLVSPEMLIWIVLDPNQTIKLRIAGHGGGQDEFTLTTNTGAPGATNVSCDTAEPISTGEAVIADTNTTNTGDPTECAYSDINPLWYSFTAPTTGYYRFATDFPADPKSFDRTALSVYTACGGDPLACTIEGDDFSTNSAAAALALHLNAGQTRIFRVSYLAPTRGVMDVSVTGPLPAPPPVTNDTCATAQVLSSMPFHAEVDVTLATPDQDVCAFEGQPNVPTPGGIWYRFTPTQERVFQAAVSTNNGFGARATLFTGSCAALTQVRCSNGLPGEEGIVLTPGTTYSILVSLDDSRIGPVGEVPYGTTFSIDLIAPTRPANDHCSGAQVVTSSNSTITINTLAADADTPQPSCIGFEGVLNNAVWYTFTPATAGELTVHGESIDFGFYSPGGALFSGSCASLTEVACDSPRDGFLITNHFDFTASLQAGATYYLVAGSWARPSGGLTEITIDYTGDIGCSADFNGDAVVNSQDFFDFLNAFFSSSPSADFNNDGVINSQDFFDFLAVFFEGCN